MLDIRTLLAANAVLLAVFSVIYLILPRQLNVRGVITELRRLVLLLLAGMVLLALRGVINDTASIVGGNLLVIGGYLCLWRAIRRLCGRPLADPAGYAVAAVYGTSLLFMLDHFPLRALASVGVFAFFVMRNGGELLCPLPVLPLFRRLHLFVALGMLVELLVRLLLVIPDAVRHFHDPVEYLSAGTPHALVMLAAMVHILLGNVGLLLLLYAHVQAESEAQTARIAERERFLQRVTAQVPGVIFTGTLAAQGKFVFTWVSQQMHEQYGHDAEQLRTDGELALRNVHPDDAGKIRDAVAASAVTLRPFTVEWRSKPPGADEYRWQRCVATPVREANGSIEWTGHFSDVHDLRTATEELQRENAWRENLMAIIAHDLRNPFSVILGFAEMLRRADNAAAAAKSVQLGEHIYRAADRAYQLLQNLLTWTRARQAPLQEETIVLAELAREAAGIATAAESSGVEVTVQMADDLRVRGDRRMLATVLRNLLGNSIKFTRAPGSVTVTATAADGQVTVAVQDTGVGMPPSVVDQVLGETPGFSLPDAQGRAGTGLGLSLCREFLARHGSALWIRSVPGEGTTVLFHLPAAQSAAGNQ